jgi:3-deoxy-D-manno-octulosonate 8-phosphate phosphatase (KDO 8-P phosphatase)
MIDAHHLRERAKSIRWLIMDVDGVFNNGQIYFSAEGEHLKPFHVHDGLGLQHLRQHKIELAIISGRSSDIVKKRFNDLGITRCYLGHLDKISIYQKIKKEEQLGDASIAYIGDDLPDLPCILKAGLGISVPNAIDSVKKQADWITQKRGGEGAIREVCDLIISAQG